MRTNRFLIAAGCVVLIASPGAAGDVKIIANASVKADSISPAEIKSIFLLQRQTLKDGSPVVPVLEKSGTAEQAFLRQYLDRGSEELRIYYQGLVFTGKASMPKQLASNAEVVAYVAKTRGAIGFISGTGDAEGVKVLLVSAEPFKGERALLTRVEPEYPETLKQMRIGGIVRLRLIVSPKGAVEAVAVLGGNPILAESAEKAAKQWVYAPGPSRTTIEVTVPFRPLP